jgi:hypothetical protein
MKPALISFALTAALLSLNVLPGVWSAGPDADAGSFEARHAGENKAEVAARLGITKY